MTWLGFLFRPRDRVARDVDTEIAFHIRERIDALVARGWSREAAHAEATRRFGNVSETRPALVAAASQRERRLDMLDRIDAVRLDLRLIARGLRHSLAFSLGTGVAFALGIGANATMFNVLDRLLLRPPPGIVSPGNVYTMRPATHGAISYPEFVAQQNELRSVATLTADLAPPFPLLLAQSGSADAQNVNSTFVDGNYFHTLGARAALGRTISEVDTQSAGAPVAVLAFGFWQSTFGGDPSVLGRVIIVGAERVRVIGVAARGFNGVDTKRCDIWLPLPLAARLTFIGPRWQTTESSWLRPIARLGTANPSLIAERATSLRHARQLTFAAADTGAMTIRSVLPSRAEHLTPEARVAAILGVVSIVVFILACTNAATLMLARAYGRRREVAVRLAIGVSHARLATQCVLEALCLAVFGGAAAFGVAVAGSVLMRRLLLREFAWDGAPIDGRTAIYIGCATAVAGLLTGVASALVLLRRFELLSVLSQGRSAGVYRHRTISALVIAQAALSAALAVGAALFGQSLLRIRVAPLGMDVGHVVVIAPDAAAVRASPVSAEQIFADYRAAVARVPAVQSVATSQGLPYVWYVASPLSVPGADAVPERARRPWVNAVTTNYFATIGTRIIAGRGFTEADDRATAEPVAILGLTLAKALWSSGEAIGRCVRLGGDSLPCLRVIAVAEDIRESPVDRADDLDARVYVPLSQRRPTYGSRAVIVRVAGDPTAAIHAIRSAVGANGASVAPPNVYPLQSRLDPELRPWRLGATIFAIFGALALGLAVIGVYSVIAYGVAQRTHELSVRIALGARRWDILSLVGMDGVRLAGVGLAIGLVAALLLSPFVQPFLFETSARSVPTYVLVVCLVILAGLAASLIPALRASRTNPMSAMRGD